MVREGRGRVEGESGRDERADRWLIARGCNRIGADERGGNTRHGIGAWARGMRGTGLAAR